MSNLKPQRGVKIQNDSGMIIPPYSIVVVTRVEYITPDPDNGIDADTIHHVTQYAGQSGNILVTGPAQINTNYGGYAYADQLIYVAVDPAITAGSTSSNAGLNAGTILGPVNGKWWVGRSGAGFSAQGSAVQVITPATNGSYADSAAVFYRGASVKTPYFGMIKSVVTPGTLSSPTSLKFDVWLPVNSSFPKSYSVSTDASLIGMDVANIECWSVSLAGSGSSSSSAAAISVPGRIDYDNQAGQWVLTGVFRCKQFATTVACSGGSLNVTYDNIPG